MEPMAEDASPAVSHWATCPKAEDFRRRPQPCPDNSPPPLFSSAPPQSTVQNPEKKGSD
jgi:hypothetical protein